MLTGIVAWFSSGKGFGFITRDDGNGDAFVHWTAIKDMEGYKKLDQGQRVKFDLSEGPKGKMQADNVVVVR